MAKAKSEPFEVECPCCGAALKIDAAVRAVLSYVEKERPKTLSDIEAGVAKLKQAEAQREDAFNKSFESLKSHKDVLARKFDELLKQAKEDPDKGPPPKPLGLE